MYCSVSFLPRSGVVIPLDGHSSHTRLSHSHPPTLLLLHKDSAPPKGSVKLLKLHAGLRASLNLIRP